VQAPANPPQGRSPGRFLRDYLETVLVAVLVVLFGTTFVVQNSVIPSASMEDTLLVGDYILVNRIAFAPEDAGAPARWLGMRPIQHADVVVFKFPGDPATDYIKRVIGLPGDVIEVKDKALYRNGELLDEPQVRHKTGIIIPRSAPDGKRDNFGPFVVPEGDLFLMGDNRDYSQDSREFGPVPRSHVTGRALVVFWSKRQGPGAQALRGTNRVRRFMRSLLTFHEDMRWRRLMKVIS